jgi:site-specific recombinase XerD
MAGTLFRRTLLMTLYATGMRRSELACLKVSDIDSQRMILRVVEGKGGKGGKDRDLPLSPALLETLREYWRWRMPKTYLFPSRDPRRGSEQPISDKTVWIACNEAAHCAGIRKRVTPPLHSPHQRQKPNVSFKPLCVSGPMSATTPTPKNGISNSPLAPLLQLCPPTW